jgi:hypothetical protein
MKTFENLNPNDKNTLMKFPAYISLLASNLDGKMDDTEKEEAIHFTHIKTFSSDPILSDFYKEAEKVFLSNIKELDKSLSKDKKLRDQEIKRELSKSEPILKRLGNDFASSMHESMQSYIKHVSKARNNVLESFFIPLYIKGLTD